MDGENGETTKAPRLRIEHKLRIHRRRRRSTKPMIMQHQLPPPPPPPLPPARSNRTTTIQPRIPTKKKVCFLFVLRHHSSYHFSHFPFHFAHCGCNSSENGRTCERKTDRTKQRKKQSGSDKVRKKSAKKAIFNHYPL